MKRVAAVSGFGFMSGLILCSFLFENALIPFASVLFALSVIAILVPKIKNRSETVMSLMSMLLACLSFACANRFVYAPSLDNVGKKCDIEATVLAYPTISSGGNYSYLIKTDTVDGREERLKMMLYLPYELSAEPYDRVSFTSAPFILGSDDMDRSYLRYFRSKGTFTGAYTKFDVAVEKNEKRTVLSSLAKFKGDSVKILGRTLGGDFAAFSVSVLFGDKTLLSPEMKETFKTAGINHIMCVSGLHMSIWVLGLYALLKRLSLGRRKASLAAIAFSFVIVCLSSFSVSVIRAAIMTGVYLGAEFFDRRSDALNSLGLAVLILCVINPYVVCDVSFLLSVFATLGIVVSANDCGAFLSKLDKKGRVGRTAKYFIDIILISLIANLFIFPVTTGFFGEASLLSWLSNVLVIPVLTPVMLLSGLLILVPSIKILALPSKIIIKLLERYIFFCVGVVSKIPFAHIILDNRIVCALVSSVLIFAVLAWHGVKEKRFSPASALVAISAVAVNICC